MNTFLRDMRILPRSVDRGERQQVVELAQLGGAEPSELLRFTPVALERKGFHTLGDEIVGYRGVNRTFFRFCPHCVAEDIKTFPGPVGARPWLRLEWTVGHFRSCDTHEVYLANTTPVRRRFEPFDFSETIATFISDIEHYRSVAERAAPSPFQTWMAARLGGQKDPANWLDQFPFYVAAEWCEALGISALHSPKVRTSQLTERDWAEAGNAGFNIAFQGAPALEELLARLNEGQRETRGFWGVHDTYGYAYKFLMRTLEDEDFSRIRDLVRNFANRTMPLEPGSDVLGVAIADPGVVTVRSAAKQSGVHDRTIRRIFDRKGLAPAAFDDNLRNHRVTVSSGDVKAMLDKLKGAISGPEVSRRFAIPRLHLNALRKVGALPTATQSENTPHAKHRFSLNDVDSMLERMFAGAEDVAAPTDRQLPVMDCRHVAGASLETVLTSVFDGTLTWKGRLAGRSGYSALLLDADELIERVRTEPVLVNCLRSDLPSLIPGLSPLAIEPLVAAGILITATEFSRNARRKVPVVLRTSVDDFNRRYVCLGGLVKSTGLHFKQVQSVLSRHRITPAFEPDEMKVWLYNRQKLRPLVESEPNVWANEPDEAPI